MEVLALCQDRTLAGPGGGAGVGVKFKRDDSRA